MKLKLSALLQLLLFVYFGAPAHAQSTELQGLWRGSGFVKPTDGQREKVRCRVTYQRHSSKRYSVSAVCASQGANIKQSGEIRGTGRNSYAGNFYNSEYGVRGRVRVRVQGRRQTVRFESKAGIGQIRLFKR